MDIYYGKLDVFYEKFGKNKKIPIPIWFLFSILLGSLYPGSWYPGTYKKHANAKPKVNWVLFIVGVFIVSIGFFFIFKQVSIYKRIPI